MDKSKYLLITIILLVSLNLNAQKKDYLEAYFTIAMTVGTESNGQRSVVFLANPVKCKYSKERPGMEIPIFEQMTIEFRAHVKTLVESTHTFLLDQTKYGKMEHWDVWESLDESQNTAIDWYNSSSTNAVQAIPTNYSFNSCPEVISESKNRTLESIETSSDNPNQYQSPVTNTPSYSTSSDAMLIKHTTDLAIGLANAFKNRKTSEHTTYKTVNGYYNTGTTVYKGNGEVHKYTGTHYMSEDENLEKIFIIREFDSNGIMKSFFSTADPAKPVYNENGGPYRKTEYFPIKLSEKFIDAKTSEKLKVKKIQTVQSENNKSDLVEYYDNGNLFYKWEFDKAIFGKFFPNSRYEIYHRNGTVAVFFSTDNKGKIIEDMVTFKEKDNTVKKTIKLKRKKIRANNVYNGRDLLNMLIEHVQN